MPSKKYNGNTPLGSLRLGSLSDVELEVAKRTPKQAMTTGVVQTHNGSFHTPRRRQRATTTTPCILGRVLIDTENTTELFPKYKINAGFLSGGGSSAIITPDNLTANIDDFVWLKVIWTANIGAEELLPGGTMGEVTVETGTEIPAELIPTSGSTNGIAYIALGGWVSNGAEEPSPVWVNQGCGSIQLYFCPGQGFIVGRNNEVEV